MIKERSAPNTVVVCCLPYIYNRGMSKDKKKDQKKIPGHKTPSSLLFLRRQNSTLFSLENFESVPCLSTSLDEKNEKKKIEQHQQNLSINSEKCEKRCPSPPFFVVFPSFYKEGNGRTHVSTSQFSGRAYLSTFFSTFLSARAARITTSNRTSWRVKRKRSASERDRERETDKTDFFRQTTRVGFKEISRKILLFC